LSPRIDCELRWRKLRLVAVDISVRAKARVRTVNVFPTHRTDSLLRHSDAEAKLLRIRLDLAASIPTCMSMLRSNGSKRRVPRAFESVSRLKTQAARTTNTRRSANSPRVSRWKPDCQSAWKILRFALSQPRLRSYRASLIFRFGTFNAGEGRKGFCQLWLGHKLGLLMVNAI
jgi:hypothetical protein